MRAILNADKEMFPLVDMDELVKKLQKEMKDDTALKALLNRYQEIYPIELGQVSTAHFQTCKDFITRFQRILNHQMKILLKLILRIEK